jgi:hypothetical protein
MSFESQTGARILVLSSHTRPDLSTPINHQIYCSRHGYDYLFDATPYPVKTGFDQKLKSVISNLGRADWLVWLDSDVYIMDQSIPLEKFLPAGDEVDFVFCNSPVNEKGQWTQLNSGVFFVRNTPRAHALMDEVFHTDLAEVRAWWRDKELGMFTNGDQDKFVYTFARYGLIGTGVRVLEYSECNSRIYEFTQAADQHFICHFCGVDEKMEAIGKFRKRFDLDAYLLPNGKVQYPESIRRSMFYVPPPPTLASLPGRLRSQFTDWLRRSRNKFRARWKQSRRLA